MTHGARWSSERQGDAWTRTGTVLGMDVTLMGVEDGGEQALVVAAQATTSALLRIYGVPLVTLVEAVTHSR